MLVVERQGPIAILTIDRPEAKNAPDHETRNELGDASAEIGGDVSVRAIVLTGGGTTFVSGGGPARLSGNSSGPLGSPDCTSTVAECCESVGWPPSAVCG